jgi:hypothetical protein
MTTTIPQDILERAREIAGDWTVNERELAQLAQSIGELALSERNAATAAQIERDAGIAINLAFDEAGRIRSASPHAARSGEPVAVSLDTRACGAEDTGRKIAAAIREQKQ